MRLVNLIQFPPEMDENWVRYGLAKLGQISRLPNWQRMLFCAYTTQLLHSTGEGCWNNKDSYFIWFEFVCRNSGQIASRRSWKRSCLGLEYTSKCSRLACPIRVSTTFNLRVALILFAMTCIANDV